MAAGTGLTRADYVDMLEELYVEPGVMDDMIYRDNAALAIFEKVENKAGGRCVHIPVKYARPSGGRSATFATAQSNRTPTQLDAFQVTYVSDYGVATVEGDVIDDAGTNTELVADALQDEMDGGIENLRDDLGMQIFRNLGGARAQVGSISTTTLTLKNIEDIVHFEVQQTLASAETDGTSGAVQSGTVLTTGVDRDAGTLEAAANWTTGIASLDADDYMFVAGDFGLKAAGLDSWCPSDAPGATAFYGVDRSVDTRMGGLRYTGTGIPLEEAAMNGAARANRWRANLDIGFLNPIQWNKLAISLESTSSRLRSGKVFGSGDQARFGFDAIIVSTPNGDIPIVSDPNCQADVLWLMRQSAFNIYHSGDKFLRFIDDDGQKAQREATNDGVEFRLKARWNMASPAPGHIMRVAITS